MKSLKTLVQISAFTVAGLIFSNPLFACEEPAANIAAGEQIYVQCSGCHSPSYHRTGPKHCGLIGRLSGSAENFTYTEAMKNANVTWTRTSLDNFLRAPLEMVPGTSMGFSGIANKQDRSNLIAYLSTLTPDNVLCK